MKNYNIYRILKKMRNNKFTQKNVSLLFTVTHRLLREEEALHESATLLFKDRDPGSSLCLDPCLHLLAYVL